MANDAARNLHTVLDNCRSAEKHRAKKDKEVVLIVVSKTFGEEEIRPVLEASHRVFGENRVQEAEAKWPKLKAEYDDIELHLIGPLQSNKAGSAVALFDVIQTVDRDKIAKAIAKEMKATNRKVRLFVQVNTGSESQKAGVAPQETEQFVKRCRDEHGLVIEGLMCIPPAGENPGPHFALLREIADKLGLKSLSMGMSSDYQTAIELGATHVRVGSAIFGRR